VPPPGLRGGVGCFPLCWRPGEPVSDVLADQLDCNLVFRPPWNDYICKLLGGHTELLKGRLHIVDVLVKNLIKIAAQLIDILEDPLGKPTVRVRVNEQLHVEHASDLKMDAQSVFCAEIFYEDEEGYQSIREAIPKGRRL